MQGHAEECPDNDNERQNEDVLQRRRHAHRTYDVAIPGGARPFRRKCQAGHPGPTDADRHGQELINEGREVFLRLMQRS
jgi:hypothetical protein